MGKDSASINRFYSGSRVKDRRGNAANNQETLCDSPGDNDTADFFVHSSLYIAFEMGLGEMNFNLQSQD